MAWVPNVMKDIMLTDGLTEAEYVLYDINKKAAQTCKQFLEKLATQLNIRPSIVATDNQAIAFKNAHYFVITISTGGLNSMSHDLAIPEQYGIYHTVGDTSGPGGWARTMRNFEVFKKLAEAINHYAPGAAVLNYSNPMITMTDVLSRICTGPVIGLCHGLFENLAFIKRLYGLKDENEISALYAGLNHFFWILKARIKNVDIIQDLKKRLNSSSITNLLKDAYSDAMGFSSKREVADELFRITGVMPYLGDRHTCEYFQTYITSKQNMKKYRIIRTSIDERKKMFRDNQNKLNEMIKGTIPKEYLSRSRETAADIISAHYYGRAFTDVGNMPNCGQIKNLPAGAVVETPVRIDRTGFSPISCGSLPPVIEAFILPWTKVFAMTTDACFNRSKHQAIQALRLDPVCGHLTSAQVKEMGGRMLAAHKQYTGFLK